MCFISCTLSQLLHSINHLFYLSLFCFSYITVNVYSGFLFTVVVIRGTEVKNFASYHDPAAGVYSVLFRASRVLLGLLITDSMCLRITRLKVVSRLNRTHTHLLTHTLTDTDTH